MSLPFQNFTGVTQETFAAISAKLEASLGLQLTGTEGIAEKDGYKISYKFNAPTCELTVQCLEHPDHVPEFLIKHKINGLINDAIKGKL